MSRLASLALLATLSACAGSVGADPRTPSGPAVSTSEMRKGTDGADHALVAPGAKLTVIEFFSHHCPCQEAHDPRLRELAKSYGPRGVAFYAVDSEAGATIERDQKESAARGYPYPVLIDVGGKLARSLGATYATYTIVLDAQGRLLYGGGIDTDKSHLTEGATPYLKNALDEALASGKVETSHTEAFGCALTLE